MVEVLVPDEAEVLVETECRLVGDLCLQHHLITAITGHPLYAHFYKSGAWEEKNHVCGDCWPVSNSAICLLAQTHITDSHTSTPEDTHIHRQILAFLLIMCNCVYNYLFIHTHSQPQLWSVIFKEQTEHHLPCLHFPQIPSQQPFNTKS